MTQWLVEEAAFVALEVAEARDQSDAAVAAERHARLTALATRAAGGR